MLTAVRGGHIICASEIAWIADPMIDRRPHSPARRSARLSRAAASFYTEFVETFPSGLAVLHLRDSRDPASWRLVAQNHVAARAVGNRIADFLRLPLDGFSASPSNTPKLYRDAIVHKCPKAIGLVRKPGSTAPHESYSLTAIPLANACVGILFEDATPRLKAIRDRIEAESRLRQLCEAVRAILWAADPATFEFRYVSPEAPIALGYWVERWRHERDFLHAHVVPEDWPLVHSTLGRVAADAAARRLDFRMVHADGRQIWFRTHVRLVRPATGHPELRGAMIDITDQKRGELGAREFSWNVLRGQEVERKRISFELHENIAQCLSSLYWMLSALAGDEPDEIDRAKQFQECIQLTQSCIDQIRSVSYELQPPVLAMLGLVPALKWHARRFAEQSGVHVGLEAPAGGGERLTEDAEMMLFRVFEESLSNIQRHARTGSAVARLRFEPDSVILEIEDGGVGVPSNLFEHLERGCFGAGLLKVREGMRQLHGSLDVESNGRGALVRATLPRPSRPVVSGLLRRARSAGLASVQKGVPAGAVARPVAKG